MDRQVRDAAMELAAGKIERQHGDLVSRVSEDLSAIALEVAARRALGEQIRRIVRIRMPRPWVLASEEASQERTGLLHGVDAHGRHESRRRADDFVDAAPVELVLRMDDAAPVHVACDEHGLSLEPDELLHDERVVTVVRELEVRGRPLDRAGLAPEGGTAP